jgi:hypothetical protein
MKMIRRRAGILVLAPQWIAPTQQVQPARNVAYFLASQIVRAAIPHELIQLLLAQKASFTFVMDGR